MSKKSVRIGIVLSIFNGEKYLREQVESIKNLRLQEWVVFWRDDDSSDGSRQLLYELVGSDKRFIEISGSGSHFGVLLSYQNLVRESLGYSWDWLAFCDQDDIWSAERFNGVEDYGVSALPSMIFGRIHLVNENGKALNKHVKSPIKNSSHLSVFENVGPGCATAINPVLAKLFSEMEVEKFSNFLHDQICFAISSFSGIIIFDQKIWTKYRLHEGNTIGMNNDFKKVLERLLPIKGQYLNRISQISRALEGLPNLEMQDKRFLQDSTSLVDSNFWKRLAYLRRWGLKRSSMAKDLYTKVKILLNM